jgi:hypothetical protein
MARFRRTDSTSAALTRCCLLWPHGIFTGLQVFNRHKSTIDIGDCLMLFTPAFARYKSKRIGVPITRNDSLSMWPNLSKILLALKFFSRNPFHPFHRSPHIAQSLLFAHYRSIPTWFAPSLSFPSVWRSSPMVRVF